MNIEASIAAELGRLTEGLKMETSTAPSKFNLGAEKSLSKPTGGTVLEALAKLEDHARAILDAANSLERQLTGNLQPPDNIASEPGEGGIWERMARQIVMIERLFAQIEVAHGHAQESLK